MTIRAAGEAVVRAVVKVVRDYVEEEHPRDDKGMWTFKQSGAAQAISGASRFRLPVEAGVAPDAVAREVENWPEGASRDLARRLTRPFEPAYLGRAPESVDVVRDGEGKLAGVVRYFVNPPTEPAEQFLGAKNWPGSPGLLQIQSLAIRPGGVRGASTSLMVHVARRASQGTRGSEVMIDVGRNNPKARDYFKALGMRGLSNGVTFAWSPAVARAVVASYDSQQRALQSGFDWELILSLEPEDGILGVEA